MAFQYPQAPIIGEIWTDPLSREWRWNGQMWHRNLKVTSVYAFNKVSNILNIPETYTPVLSLIAPDCPAGTYELKMAMTWQLDVASKSVYFRWREDGGTWTEAVSEPKDRTDHVLSSYFYPKIWAGGTKTIEAEMRKEDAIGVLDLHFLDIIWDQKD